MPGSINEIRKRPQGSFPILAVYPALPLADTPVMMTTVELLAALQRKLDAKEITKTQIAEAAGIGNSRVSELFGSGRGRGLKHDEAVKLAEAFRLEPDPPATALPHSMCRLLVRHVSQRLGVSLSEDDPRLAELATTFQAFSRFVSDPQVRESIAAAEGFFHAMEALQSVTEEATQRETDPSQAS